MEGNVNILSLKRAFDKNPKSHIFAQYADAIRASSNGEEQKLEEALTVLNKGLEIYPDFLTAKFVKSRVLFEKGDFLAAKIDLETITEQDPFCLSAQRMLLETLNKLGEQPKTNINSQILSFFEDCKGHETPKTEKVNKIKTETEASSLDAALDDILKSDDLDEESELSNLLMQTFEKIFNPVEPVKVVEKKPKAELKLEPESESKLEPEPELEKKELPSLTSNEMISPSNDNEDKEPSVLNLEEPTVKEQPEVDLDFLISEQLADKTTEDVPDVTEDINALLNSTPAIEEEKEEQPNIEPTAIKAPEVDLDFLISEQLADKTTEDVPDVTEDINALLNSTPAPAIEEEKYEKPNIEPTAIKEPEVDLDFLISEQLADKTTEDVPDVTEDINALLGQAEAEPELMPYVPPTKKIKDVSETSIQNPTLTLAELYMDQGLPQKAVEVYKELLARDPKNVELQTKLALAEMQI